MDDLRYGPVLIIKGPNKGKIGYYDNDDERDNNIYVYPNTPIYCERYYLIRRSNVTPIIPTESIATRWEDIEHTLYCDCFEHKLKPEELIDLLHERIFCADLLHERYLRAMESIESQNNHRVFISHSSKDLIFARCIATDLLIAGYAVFLDDWSIDVGDRIFEEINSGLKDCHALIMIISRDYLQSICCNDEWSSFYNKTLHMGNCKIYPIIIDESEPPMLINQIKYLRINRDEYSAGLSSLLKALKKQFEFNG